MENVIKELEEYNELCLDEFAEVNESLISVYHHRDYLPKWCIKHIENVLKEHLQYYKDNSEITERTIKITETFKELEWNIYD